MKSLVKSAYKLTIMGAILTFALFGFAGNVFAVTAPSLGTASDFAALGTAVTLSDSTVTGDVGSTVNGVSTTTSTVNGTTYPGADSAVVTAHNDFLSAYGTVASTTVATTTTGTLAGQTLTPGVYSFDISGKTGTLTLDAQGDPNAVWIFKSAVATGYLAATDFNVVFLGGVGSASNVFWWTDAYATLTTSNFKGTILSGAYTTVTGGTLNGRALATGAVTVTTSSTVTVPVAPLSSTKDITSFAFGASTGVITGTNISVIVPSGTNLTALTPTIGITGESVSPSSGVAQNFSNPVTYTVTAADNSTKVYTVTVTTYYNDVIKAADRLVVLQNANGSWDWDVTNATGPTAATYYSLAGVTAQGLLDAYALSNNQTYLNSAKKAGDFIVGRAISPTQSQNAYNVVFLQDLATVSGVSTYSTKANDILTSVFTGDNLWAHDNGSFCSATTGCTPTQLVAAYANYRSSNRGMVPWDIAPFVLAEIHAGNTSLAQEIEAAMIVDTANYNNTATAYEIGLTSKVIAAAAVNDVNLSSYVTELVSSQHGDGSFGLADDGQVQMTSYALRGLVAVGGNQSAVDAAATFLGLKFGLPYAFDGWKDTSGPEFAEGDSEAMHALFSVLPASIPSATFSEAISQTGTGGSGTVTVEIPQDTTVLGNSSWDGVLDPPAPTTATVTVSGFDTTVTSAITVGSTDSDLTFDKAVKLTFAGQAGKLIGWYNHAGDFSEITAPCASNDQATGDALPAGSSCKIDVGSDLVVWTKHFSTFVTYTQSATPIPSTPQLGGGHRNSGGGGGAVVATAPTIGQVLGASAFNFSRSLNSGVRGDDVTELQNRLTSEGLYKGPITGYFGSLTAQAVKAYQSKVGVSSTGYVGPLTLAKLNSNNQVLGAQTENVGNLANASARMDSIKTQITILMQQLVKMLQDQIKAQQ